jgi:ABC-type transport system involved in multi-copper enzyme maturation permease subunit
MRSFGWLTLEAFADALRRRTAAALAFACLISLLMLDRCTSCAPRIEVGGEIRELTELAGAAGLGVFVVLGLWLVALAGVLAADHLRSTLEDGSAVLSLARPVSRDGFALARLAGVLGLAFAAGLVVLGAAAGLLAARGGVPLGPALGAGFACALGCITVAALAMTASLALPRAATLLLVLGGVALVALANGLGTLGELEGWLGALDRLGPPLASSMVHALAPWLPSATLPERSEQVFARLVAWAIASLFALVFAFRRVELRG